MSNIIPYAVVSWSGTFGGDYEVCLEVEKIHFIVTLVRQAQHNRGNSSEIESIIERLEQLEPFDDAYEEVQNELLDLLGPLCQRFFGEFAKPLGNDLGSHVKRPRLLLELVTTEERPQIRQKSNGLLPPLGYYRPDIEGLGYLPRYQLSDASVSEGLLSDKNFIVTLTGHMFFCKMASNLHASFEREIHTLVKVSALIESGVSLCIPTLQGIIGFDEGFPGMLIKHIPRQQRLSAIDMESTPIDERRQWANQIRGTVLNLHKHNIFWGDVKTENVLIDEARNAWVVDFGLGFTEGWVSQDIVGTEQGDLVGLDKILRILGTK
ncbi:hypothetical protein BDV33DRAFT_184614 [Aspergillus novoparasiticus]|uniref:Protein kinase domain-containing protein n=1 Tax=Aspergillus novoparasiticus TaxID=986946 RepID=A0A5N6E7Z5_9EURO|nr:hypothetical protein BDV33DRAFT_184614 [Aspergillus novoparasiticus]